MEVKGVAFVARKNALIKQFGEKKFAELMKEVAEKEEYFKDPFINQATLIPIEKFLLFNDMMVNKFYGGDAKIYWKMGEKSAEFSLIEGPFKVFIQNKSIEDACKTSIPNVWKVYYNEGRVETKFEKGMVNIRILDVPILHSYFEYALMGYYVKLLELVGAKSIKYDAIKTVEKGDTEIEYVFHFQ